MTTIDRPNTAIIGAGIAGLACARALQDAGHPVTLFEKARGPGGRMASRHLGTATVDLGAQYFSVRMKPSEAKSSSGWPLAWWPLGPASHYRVDGN
ncbi:FAD-dependent oxidoreductase [Billgrantia gudaonensis]|uniref:FAD-dependent oxidoreductase n=1 Tax=Billgrantia gudaonensis TaxID=376427 RepID=A0A3S0VT94_9GAMM|nr:FAD-dependent oxidoreductase [Halomonas gudaonensis]